MGVPAAGGPSGRAVTGRWGALVAAVARREPATAVAVVRIVYGVAIAAHHLRLALTGTWRWIWLPPEAGGLVPIDGGLFDLVGGPTADTVGPAVGFTIVAAIALAVGWGTPVAAAATAFGWAVTTGLGANAGGSYDLLGGNVCFLLIFAGSGGAWSVDAWRRRRRGLPVADAPVWPRWLMVWQLVLMYSTTAWQKVSAGWVLGGPADALWYILQQPTWQLRDMRWVAPYYPLTQAMTSLTWAWEHAAVVLVAAAWFRATRCRPGWLRAQFNRFDVRAPYLAFGVLLHLGIELTMEVGAFTPFTLALYAACFSGDELTRRR